MISSRTVAGIVFQNPVLLASGTAGFGREVAGVIDLDRIGGVVTKAVSLAPRVGNPPPRVAEREHGMLNSIGLANPGVEHVIAHELPWLAEHHAALPVLVNVVGFVRDEYAHVVQRIDERCAPAGYELNLSCPNTEAGGVEFGLDGEAVHGVIAACRRVTRRPMFAKLSPAAADLPVLARRARDAGADGVTLVNTMPELSQGRLGAARCGLSGPAIRPIALRAIAQVAKALPGFPIVGAGGIQRIDHARAALEAGAALIEIGTGALVDPRIPERIVAGLARDG